MVADPFTLARIFKALGHPVRLRILEALLEDGEACVCHLEHRLGLRQAYLSQHLARLRAAGLVVDRRSGQNVFYAVSGAWILSVLSAVEGVPVPAGKGMRTGGMSRKAARGCPCPRCREGRDGQVAPSAQAQATGARV